MKVQTINSLLVIRRNRQIAFYIIFSELIFSFTVSLFFYLQNYWKGIGYTEFHIGIIFAVSSLFSGLTSLLAHKIEKRIGGEQGLVLMILIFPIIGFIGENFGLDKAFLVITITASIMGFIYYIHWWRRSQVDKDLR